MALLPAIVVIGVVMYFKPLSLTVEHNGVDVRIKRPSYVFSIYELPLRVYPFNLHDYGKSRSLGYKTNVKGIFRYNYDLNKYFRTTENEMIKGSIVVFNENNKNVYYRLCDYSEIIDGQKVQFEGYIDELITKDGDINKCIKPIGRIEATNINSIINSAVTEYSKTIPYFQTEADQIVNDNIDYKLNQKIDENNILAMMDVGLSFGENGEETYYIFLRYSQNEADNLYIKLQTDSKGKILNVEMFAIDLK